MAKRKAFVMRQLNQDAVPTTSLADMMFLLLIFFIMTTTLTRITGFSTDVPSGDKGKEASQSQEKTPTVDLHGDKITVSGESMNMDALRKHIRGLHLDKKVGDGKVVILSATGPVKYQTYFEAMALIQTSGGIVAIIREEGESK